MQAKFVKDQVTVPLETLLGLFQNPLHLIEKRKDKLLDYDHMQYALDHAEESEKIAQFREESLLAKRNYEALNTQLLEELPQFIEAVLNMLNHQLTVLVQAQYNFTSSVSSFLESLPCLSGSTSSSTQEVEQQHAEQMVVICKELSKLSLVPTTLGINFSIRTKGSTSSLRRNSDTVSPTTSSSGANSPPTGEGMAILSTSREEEEEEEREQDDREEQEVKEQEVEQEEEEEEEEVSEPSEGSQLLVLFDFEGQDDAELSVVTGQVVVLLCAHDRIGCKDWWLVQQQDPPSPGGKPGFGYVPAGYLTECDAGLS